MLTYAVSVIKPSRVEERNGLRRAELRGFFRSAAVLRTLSGRDLLQDRCRRVHCLPHAVVHVDVEVIGQPTGEQDSVGADLVAQEVLIVVVERAVVRQFDWVVTGRRGGNSKPRTVPEIDCPEACLVSWIRMKGYSSPG